MKKRKVTKKTVLIGMLLLILAPGLIKGLFDVGYEFGKALAHWF